MDPYRWITYTNWEHHCFMSRLSGILHDNDIDWWDSYYEDRELKNGDHDLDWDSNEDFYDDDF